MDKTILRKIITRKDPVIFEIGAHYGEDSQHFIDMYPHGDIYLFEPDPRCIQKIIARGINCHLYQGAVSDFDGTTNFYPCGEGYDGSGSILVHSNLLYELWSDLKPNEPFSVKCTTLDSYVLQKEISVIDFMWMDSQGAEEKIIQGGISTFTDKVKYLYTEYCQSELYKGCPTRERILEMLPFYTILSDIGSHISGDMLLVNTKIV